jgi:two-component system, cell cycle response regulator DivK
MKTILVVDDNFDNRYIASQMLNLNGYTTIDAVNGVQALEVLQRTTPDLILMDLTMPLMDGWEAARRIKAQPRLAHIPILAVTSHAVEEELQRAKASGCDDYLIKPFEYTMLIEKVKANLG